MDCPGLMGRPQYFLTLLRTKTYWTVARQKKKEEQSGHLNFAFDMSKNATITCVFLVLKSRLSLITCHFNSLFEVVNCLSC